MTAHVRTGAQYLAALQDSREVYLDGKRVQDVTSEPGLNTVALTFARMYDLANEPEYQAALTSAVDVIRNDYETALAPADQAHRSAREHAAIALEVGAPGFVVDLV